MGYTLVNNVTATVATQSNSGTTSLVVGTGLGAQFASATTANPIRCGAFDSTGALKFYFDVTARSTDTLTVANRGAESTTDANILTTDVVAAITTTTVMNSLPLGLGVYGDGSDGTVTFDGTTTILGLAPASSAYTLTRDLVLAAGTINSGVTIKASGFRIFCAGTLTNNGTIHNNGNNGTGGGAGATTNSFGSLQIGAAGGGTSTTTGSAGGASNPGLGGAGGHGGAGASGAGGAGGAVTAPAATFGTARILPAAVFTATFGAGGSWSIYKGGAGGAGGGGDGTNTGGPGGGGGGLVVVAARTFAGTGTISANGGNGFTPTLGNTGGGGGGGGGVVVVISGSVASGAISGQTVTASAGTTGGAAGTGGSGATSPGAGTVILIPN